MATAQWNLNTVYCYTVIIDTPYYRHSDNIRLYINIMYNEIVYFVINFTPRRNSTEYGVRAG